MAFQNSADDVQGRSQVTGAQAGGLPMLIAALAQGAQGGGQQRTPFDPSGSQPLLTPNTPDAGRMTPQIDPPLLTPHDGGFLPPPQQQLLVTPRGPSDVPQGGGMVAPPQSQPLLTPHNPGDTPQGNTPQGNPQQGGGLGNILQLLGGLFGGGQGQQGGMGGVGGLLGLLQGVLGGQQGGGGFQPLPGQQQPLLTPHQPMGQQGFQNNMGPYSQRLAQGLGGNRNFYTPHNNVPQGIPPIMYALMAMQQHMRQTQPVMRQQPQGPAQPQPATGQPQDSLMDNPGGNPQNNMAHNPAIDRFRARRGLEE